MDTNPTIFLGFCGHYLYRDNSSLTYFVIILNRQCKSFIIVKIQLIHFLISLFLSFLSVNCSMNGPEIINAWAE